MHPKLSVVICTYNRAESLHRVLGQLVAQSAAHDGVEIVVVDNNSTDHTSTVVSALAPTSSQRVRYLRESRQGITHARNAGIRASFGTAVAFIDDDVSLDSRWLAAVLQMLDSRHAAAFGGRVVPVFISPLPRWFSADPPCRLSGFYPSHDNGDQPRDYAADHLAPPITANSLVRRSAFEKYGLFRNDLGYVGSGGLINQEDTEFFTRLLKVGEQVLYMPQATVYHPVDPSRLTCQYVLRWAFANGRGAARWRNVPPSCVRVAGIPRYLLRSLLHQVLQWLVGSVRREPKRSFYHLFQAFHIAGQVVEYRKLAHLPRSYNERQRCDSGS